MKTQKTGLSGVVLAFAAALVMISQVAFAKDDAVFGTEPKLNDGQKWRIAYYEGGPYLNYVQTLETTVLGLMGLGWIKAATLPPRDGENLDGLWKWLATEAQSDYLEFVEDGFYTSHWDDAQRKENSAKLLKRLSEAKDLDLMLAMGTQAGKDLANDQHTVATMVMSTSDPIGSGIIKSVEDSGFDHVHARLDPDRHKRQLTVFHEIARFKKLGVAYEDSSDGRIYAALDAIQALAKARGFQVEVCHTKSDVSETKDAEASVTECIERLSKVADAIYLTRQGGVTRNSIPEIVKITIEHHVPTFSQAGAEEVRLGIMVSLSRAGFRYVGEFHAKTIAKVFNGAKPNQLDQILEEPPKIAINLKTAEEVGFDPPVVLIGAADEIFDEIPGMK